MSGNAGFTGVIPHIYDHGLGPVLFAGYAAEMARRVAALGPANVLEIAAGTGIVTRELRDALRPSSRLTATDLNPPMLDVARAKFQPAEDVVFQAADALDLPFGDASFDAVVCQFGIMFYPDRDQANREAFRVLKPGGHYLFSTWDSHDHNPSGRIGHSAVQGFFPDNPPPFYRVPFSCHEIDPIRQAINQAGFTGFHADIVTLDKIIPDTPAFAHAMVHGNPLATQVAERGGKADDLVADILAALHTEIGPDPIRMPLQALMFQVQKPG